MGNEDKGPFSIGWVPAVMVLLGAAALLRLATGLHGYSGQGVPPKYGDYEAQRHWMEITLHTPASEWYVETPDNDLSYWGIDYPPLSAYQSLAYGKAISLVEPAALELGTSRGYETPSSKHLMRLSVLFSDVVFLLPAAFLACRVFTAGQPTATRLWYLAAILLQPAALLIDHGHFQYNNINLGLAAAAASAVAAGWDCTGSVLFCLALNHKQMAMYYAPAFFAHLLGKCLARPGGLLPKFSAVAKLGVVVVFTFGLVWAVFLFPNPALALQVLRRLVPIHRGLFEDYVANFWCASNVAIKWKQLFDNPQLWRMCTSATLAAFLPSTLQQGARPSREGLLLCLANTAFAFFLFSYQVHEKSILLPLMPIMLLADKEPYIAAALPVVASFSMYPLLKKDGVAIAYAGNVLCWVALASPKLFPRGRPLLQAISILAFLVMALIHAAEAFIPVPSKYPFLYDLLMVSFSFVCFAATAIYLNLRQLRLPADASATAATTAKKHN